VRTGQSINLNDRILPFVTKQPKSRFNQKTDSFGNDWRFMIPDKTMRACEPQSDEPHMPDSPARKEVLSPQAQARRAAADARREQRLAQALRENLKRRKAQLRTRATQTAAEPPHRIGSAHPSSDNM